MTFCSVRYIQYCLWSEDNVHVPLTCGGGRKAGKPVTDNAIVLPICLGLVEEDAIILILLPCVHLCVCFSVICGEDNI